MKGLWIGAAGGGVIGLLGGLGIASALCETGESCNPGAGAKMVFAFAGLGSGAIVGGVIGLAIGAAIPKRDRVTVVPSVMMKYDQPGMGMMIQGRFQ